MSKRGFLNSPVHQAGYVIPQPIVNIQPVEVQVVKEQTVEPIQQPVKPQIIIEKQKELSQLINQLKQQNIKQSAKQTIEVKKIIQPLKQVMPTIPKKKGGSKGAK